MKNLMGAFIVAIGLILNSPISASSAEIPRSFGKARLGMTRQEFVAAVGIEPLSTDQDFKYYSVVPPRATAAFQDLSESTSPIHSILYFFDYHKSNNRSLACADKWIWTDRLWQIIVEYKAGDSEAEEFSRYKQLETLAQQQYGGDPKEASSCQLDSAGKMPRTCSNGWGTDAISIQLNLDRGLTVGTGKLVKRFTDRTIYQRIKEAEAQCDKQRAQEEKEARAAREAKMKAGSTPNIGDEK